MINTLTGEYLTLSIYLYAREPLKATFDVKFVDFTIIFFTINDNNFKILDCENTKMMVCIFKSF